MHKNKAYLDLIQIKINKIIYSIKMKNNYFKHTALVAFAVLSLASCKKDNVEEEVIAPYDVPKTYNFSDAKYATSTARVKMWAELTGYTTTGSSSAVSLDATKTNNLWNNTNNPFTDATLNASGVNIAGKITDGATFKAIVDNLVTTSQTLTATGSNGTAGYVSRTATTKVAVDGKGLEYQQGIAKGLMGSLLFKQAVDLLAAVKTDATIELQKQHFDEAFGYLNVPIDYDPTVDYTKLATGDPKKPLAWGGYLWERGRGIKAGEIIFNAFLTGRAAIGAKDVKVRDAQIQIILDKWEQLAAAAALEYVTSPTTGDVGLGLWPGAKFHALSEGWGFIATFKYRPASSKLTAANYTKLNDIINTSFYTLLNEPGYPKLVEAQGILKATYGL